MIKKVLKNLKRINLIISSVAIIHEAQPPKTQIIIVNIAICQLIYLKRCT